MLTKAPLTAQPILRQPIATASLVRWETPTSRWQTVSCDIRHSPRVTRSPVHRVSFVIGDWPHWRIQPPILGGGGNLGRGPNLGYPKTENSTDLTQYFFFWMDPNLLSKKNWTFWGGGKRHHGPTFLGFGGHVRVVPPPPWIRQ